MRFFISRVSRMYQSMQEDAFRAVLTLQRLRAVVAMRRSSLRKTRCEGSRWSSLRKTRCRESRDYPPAFLRAEGRMQHESHPQGKERITPCCYWYEGCQFLGFAVMRSGQRTELSCVTMKGPSKNFLLTNCCGSSCHL